MKKYFLCIGFLFNVLICSQAQHGSVISQSTIDIFKTDVGDMIGSNDSLSADYKFVNDLIYSEIGYESDGSEVKGLVIAPKQKGEYPIIIFNRGGNRDFNPLTFKMLFFSTAVLANEGYIILASNYRDKDEYGGGDVNDVLHLIDVASQIENADTSKIGMFGWSRGGMMTYLALKESNRIKTAVIGNGASDLFLSVKNRPELETRVLSECIPNYWENRTNELIKRSALFWADSLNKESSLLLLCGRWDAQVSYLQSVRIASKLDSLNYNCQLKIYETNHGFQGKRKELNNELINWFDTHLKNVPKTSRRRIAITIDDVPNTYKFQKDNYHSHLLEVLDSVHIPISIFINEGLISRTKDSIKNEVLLENWMKRNYITAGNHTYSHLRYSDVGIDLFRNDIEKGERITRPMAGKYNKNLEYFRFPYNDLGSDSTQQLEIKEALKNLNYKIAPFTIESSDWMFNAIYEYYLSMNEFENAQKIGKQYVLKTMEYIHFFDSLSNTIYGRNINHIYLCHDNSINADFLKEVIATLTAEGYEFTSINEAMQDPVYIQENRYNMKWGVSWLYRWMTTKEQRMTWMKSEPDLDNIETLFEKLTEKGSID